MKSIFISIIVPIYNAELTLRRCLDSILSQSFTNFELLLINDGSTDSSEEICKEYALKDFRIKVLKKENGGASSARNLGLRKVCGEWVAFCDSDDYVDDNWLDIFIQNINDNQLIIQRLIVDNDTQKLDLGFCFDGNAQEGLLLMHQKGIVGYMVIKLFQVKIIKNHDLRFEEKFKFREDEDFVLKYLQYITKMKAVDIGAYHYDMPDLSTKYLSVDTFYCSLSMYVSVKRILGKVSGVTQNYLLELTNSLFDAYSKQDKKCKDKLCLYMNAVKKDFFAISQISDISKFVYACGKNLAHIAFSFKAKLANKNNYYK